jgi:hypothetical protein
VRPVRPEHAPRERAPRVEEPVEEKPAEAPRRDFVRRERYSRDREPRHSDRENGPSVLGFGKDVPAFMLIRRRGPVKETEIEEAEEETGLDVASDGEEIAA